MLDRLNDEALASMPAFDPVPTKIPVTLIAGDGIGSEVSKAARSVLSAACPDLEWIEAEGGASVMEKGIPTGLPAETLDAVEQTGVVLKGPLATPIGYGGKSANVALRKLFELYGNIRPIRAYPRVDSPYKGRNINFTIVRENVEDLYAGIEHMQTPDVAQCLKLISRQGSERIARLAFAIARAESRTSVTCTTKSNIMKLTEGLFQRSFETVAADHTAFVSSHMLVDNCAHQMVMRPEQFEVVVCSNMNGDILSDLAAGLVGGLGLAPSANIGDFAAAFEAVHGSAPDIAGQNRANPTALIMAGAMMMRHLGKPEIGTRIETAVRLAYDKAKDLPADVAHQGPPGTTFAFTDRILAELDRLPSNVGAPVDPIVISSVKKPVEQNVIQLARRFDGVDIFVEWNGPVERLAGKLKAIAELGPLRLALISNRGTMMWPDGAGNADTVPHWRCRFVSVAGHDGVEAEIPGLLSRIGQHLRWMHVEKLETHNGIPAYSRAMGEPNIQH